METFILGRYGVKNESEKIKKIKQYFFQRNDYFVPVLKGYSGNREFEKVKRAAKDNDMGISERFEEKINYDRTILQIKVSNNLNFEVIKIEHEEFGVIVYFEKCIITGEDILEEDMDYLLKII